MADKEADKAITEDVEELDKETIQVKDAPKPDETEADDKTEAEDEEGEVVVSIAGVSPTSEEDAEEDTPTFRDLRQRYKETARQNRELTERLNKIEAPVNKAIEVGPKPTLESCEYDEANFETSLLAWQEKKRAADAEAQNKAKEVEAVEADYKKRQANYETAKGNLKVKDFSDAEEAVKNNFSLMQQAIIIKGALDSAVVVYALGKNPEKAKELAAIKDPVEFAFAVARLEGLLKVTTKKAPAPEKKLIGSGGSSNSGATDKKLATLRAEAEKTGNYTEVTKYKRLLKK